MTYPTLSTTAEVQGGIELPTTIRTNTFLLTSRNHLANHCQQGYHIHRLPARILSIASSSIQLSRMSDPITVEDLFDQGLQIRRAVVGNDFVDRALQNGSSEFSSPGQELVTTWCWGWTWGRPGLSRRDRSLLNLGMLMALNRPTELGVHVRGARRNGCSELEIREALLHATIYCGVPSGVDGMKIAEKVLNEMAERGEAERELGHKASKS